MNFCWLSNFSHEFSAAVSESIDFQVFSNGFCGCAIGFVRPGGGPNFFPGSGSDLTTALIDAGAIVKL